MKVNEIKQITTSAIRGTARKNGLPHIDRVIAFEIWDEIARCSPNTIAGKAYFTLTEKQREDVLADAFC